jgi:hypothetical protein
MTFIAADPRPAQGGGEHLSERTSNVRERGRAGANAAIGRSSER